MGCHERNKVFVEFTDDQHGCIGIREVFANGGLRADIVHKARTNFDCERLK